MRHRFLPKVLRIVFAKGSKNPKRRRYVACESSRRRAAHSKKASEFGVRRPQLKSRSDKIPAALWILRMIEDQLLVILDLTKYESKAPPIFYLSEMVVEGGALQIISRCRNAAYKFFR